MRSQLNIIVILIFIFGIVALSSSGLFGSLAGFTTLSLSQASFTSSSSFFNNEKMWILNVVQGGLSQSAQGVVDNSEIGAKTGTTPSKDFSLNLNYATQTCEYPISHDYNTINLQRLFLSEWGNCLWSPSQSDAATHCPNGMLYYGKYSGELSCFCIASSESYAIGDIGNPAIHTITTVTASNGLSSETKTFDTKNTINGYVGNDVFVSWNGYLSSGTPCDGTSSYLASYVNGWKVISHSAYDNYHSYFTNLDSSIGAGMNRATVQNKVNLINSAFDSAKSGAAFGSVFNPTSSDGAIIIKDVSSSSIAFPVWTFYVRASWLGIYQPVAKASIVDIKGVSFASGSNGNIYALIKNIGSERGTINVGATCESPFMQSGNIISNTLEPNQTMPYYISIKASASVVTTKTCTVCAEVLGEKSCKTVSVTVSPILVCNPDEKSCSDDKIIQCNIGGSGYNNIEDCRAKQMVCEYSVIGVPACVSSVPVVCEWYDIICQWNHLDLSNIGGFLLNVIAVIVLIIVIWFGLSLVSPIIPKPQIFIRRIIRK